MIRFALRWIFRIVAGIVLIVVGYFAVTAVQVWLTSRRYDPRVATAAVVMGAAQYNGVPSPDLAARLNEALLLWRQHYVPEVVVTGYKEPGDAYTEAQSGKMYLTSKGMPATDIQEAGGSDSWSNLTGADDVLKGQGHPNAAVLMVTDPFHEDRSMAIASTLGLQPYPTPTRTSPIRGWSTVPYFAKETLGVGLGRIIGFQNLDPFHLAIETGTGPTDRRLALG